MTLLSKIEVIRWTELEINIVSPSLFTLAYVQKLKIEYIFRINFRAISWTTEPKLGLFVLNWMLFSWWIQIWLWKFKFRKFLKKKLETLNLSSARDIRVERFKSYLICATRIFTTKERLNQITITSFLFYLKRHTLKQFSGEFITHSITRFALNVSVLNKSFTLNMLKSIIKSASFLNEMYS